MNGIKTLTAIVAMTAAFSVNAGYRIQIPLEQSGGGNLPNGSIVFTGEAEQAPVQTPKHKCELSADNIKSYAQSLGIDIAVSNGYSGNNCNSDIYGINSFSSADELESIGNYILNINSSEYTTSSTMYGFSDGFGRSLIWNGKVWANQIWLEK